MVVCWKDAGINCYVVLLFNRPQSKGWPHHGLDYFLHLSLCCVILIDSSTGSPVHILMLSIQAMCDLPRLPASGIVCYVVPYKKYIYWFKFVVCCVIGKNLYNNEHVAVKLVSFAFHGFSVFWQIWFKIVASSVWFLFLIWDLQSIVWR